MSKTPKMQEVSHLLLDFDGVLTDNMVYVDQNGIETVKCNRSDGYGLKLIKGLARRLRHNIIIEVITMEENLVASTRCRKLNISCLQGLVRKQDYIAKLRKEISDSGSIAWNKILYVGNDLNDLACISIADYSFCPSDSHEEVQKEVDLVLNAKGGTGVLREIAELLLYNEGIPASKFHELISDS